MNHVPVRARILLAFRDEQTVLTRQQAMTLAKTQDGNEFRLLVDGDFLRATDWAPNRPREFHITPAGADRRDKHKGFAELVS